MVDDIRHTLSTLLQERGLSLAAASRAIGRNSAYLQQFVKRGSPRHLDPDTALALAALLGVPAARLGLEAEEGGRAYQTPEANVRLGDERDTRVIAAASLRKDVPVMGSTVGGQQGDFSLNGEVVDYVRRPPAIEAVRGAFALYVQGDSMWPWRQAGGLVYVHPARPPRVGDHVVVELHGAGEDQQEERPCFVKRLVARTPTLLRLAQYNPPRDDIAFELGRVRSVYRVLEWEELLGL